MIEENTEEDLTPEEILRRYESDTYIEKYGGKSVFRQFFTPEARVLVLDALIDERGDAITAQRIINRYDNLSEFVFDHHRKALFDLGVVVDNGTENGETTYKLNKDHPIVQLLAMIENILMWGKTPNFLKAVFIEDNDGK